MSSAIRGKNQDSFSVLGLPGGRRVSKTFSPFQPPIQYPNAKMWTFVEYGFDDFDGMCKALSFLQSYGSAMVIRAEICPDVDTSRPIIRRKDDHQDGLGVTFREGASGNRWMMGDVDNFPNPIGRKPIDEAEMRALTYTVYTDVLPAEFRDVYYWFQWSNSMGTGATADWLLLKIHFWVLLQDAYTDTVIGQWAEGIDGLDPCVFRSVQPHYIASPQFVDGLDDPVGAWRSGAVKEFGTRQRATLDYTYVPHQVFEAQAKAATRDYQNNWKNSVANFHWIDVDRVSAPMQRIAAVGVDGRLHNPIIRSAASWVTCCGENPDYSAWVALVRGQIAVSGHPESRQRSSENYLRQVWQSALRKFQPSNPKNPPVPRELLINKNQY
jgi:hypothetical protein